jgi:hypothetical protein
LSYLGFHQLLAERLLPTKTAWAQIPR